MSSWHQWGRSWSEIRTRGGAGLKVLEWKLHLHPPTPGIAISTRLTILRLHSFLKDLGPRGMLMQVCRMENAGYRDTLHCLQDSGNNLRIVFHLSIFISSCANGTRWVPTDRVLCWAPKVLKKWLLMGLNQVKVVETWLDLSDSPFRAPPRVVATESIASTVGRLPFYDAPLLMLSMRP